MSSLRYEVGTKFSVEFEIVDLDDYGIPYLAKSVVVDKEGDPIMSSWLSEYHLGELISVSNPEIKRKRIEDEIAKLQAELLNIK